jgi:hypothetical protein
MVSRKGAKAQSEYQINHEGTKDTKIWSSALFTRRIFVLLVFFVMKFFSLRLRAFA